MSGVRDEIDRRWSLFSARMKFSGNTAASLTNLVSAYESPERRYHNLAHIHQCLKELDDARDSCHDEATVEAAIWFHDAVYDAKRSDNEQQSANKAAEELKKLGATNSFIATVAELILDTRHLTPPAGDDGKLLVDIDLSILGASNEDVDTYERNIRTEYSHVSDDAFRVGRLAVLQRFLKRPKIFLTEPFHKRLEARARENLNRSIARLRQE
jgi:predicted metal-dependent HD superfamily phosphohydrolase